jgi:hypothetical protein
MQDGLDGRERVSLWGHELFKMELGFAERRKPNLSNHMYDAISGHPYIVVFTPIHNSHNSSSPRHHRIDSHSTSFELDSPPRHKRDTTSVLGLDATTWSVNAAEYCYSCRYSCYSIASMAWYAMSLTDSAFVMYLDAAPSHGMAHQHTGSLLLHTARLHQFSLLSEARRLCCMPLIHKLSTELLID